MRRFTFTAYSIYATTRSTYSLLFALIFNINIYYTNPSLPPNYLSANASALSTLLGPSTLRDAT